MTKEGARIEILLNATARRNPEGKVIGVVGECSVVVLHIFVLQLRTISTFTSGIDVHRHRAGKSGFHHLDSLIDLTT